MVIGAHELQPDRDHDRRRPLGDGVRGHGRRDRLPQPQAGPGGRDQGRRARGPEAQGRGHRDRRLGARPRQRQPPARRRARSAPTPATSRRTSRSRSRSRTRRRTCAPASTPPPTSPPRPARRRSRCPVQAVVVREVDKEGKVVDPESFGGPEPAREGNTVSAAAAREKGKETDGVFVRRRREGGLQARQDRHHGRDRHRDHRRPRRGPGDRDRLLQDAAHAQGPGQDQDRARGRSRERRQRRRGDGRRTTAT